MFYDLQNKKYFPGGIYRGEHQGASRSDRNVPYLDSGVDSIGVELQSNPVNYMLKMDAFYFR